MRSPLLLEPPLLLPDDLGRVHGAPLERRVRLGHVRRDAHGDVRSPTSVGLPLLAQGALHRLTDEAHLRAEPDDLAHVRLVLRGQPDHEVELHPRPPARKDALGGLEDLRQGDVLVDDVAHPLAAGLGGEGDAGRANAREVVEDVLFEAVRSQRRHAERHLLRGEPVAQRLHERCDAGAVGRRQRREADLVRPALSNGAQHRLDDGVRIALADGAVDHPPLAEPAPLGAPAGNLDRDALEDGLAAADRAIVGEGPGVQALDQRPADGQWRLGDEGAGHHREAGLGVSTRSRRATARRPPPACAGRSRAARGTPRFLRSVQRSATSVARSSPSPTTTASRKVASGSGWVAVGPPARTSGSSSPRARASERDAAEVEHGQDVRVGELELQEKPTTSKSDSGRALSSDTSGSAPGAQLAPPCRPTGCSSARPACAGRRSGAGRGS